MTGATLEYAVRMLDAQYRAIITAEPNEIKTQLAYYEGLRRMLDIIVSDGYTQPYYIKQNDVKLHKLAKG